MDVENFFVGEINDFVKGILVENFEVKWFMNVWVYFFKVFFRGLWMFSNVLEVMNYFRCYFNWRYILYNGRMGKLCISRCYIKICEWKYCWEF